MDWLAAYLTLAFIIGLGLFGSQVRKLGAKFAAVLGLFVGLLWLPVLLLVAAVFIWPQKAGEIERSVMDGTDQWE